MDSTSIVAFLELAEFLQADIAVLAAGRLDHTGYAPRERKGDGQVILFIDYPTYRAWILDSLDRRHLMC